MDVSQPEGPTQLYRVLVVCLGNICRSPMAEIVLRAKLAAAGLADRVVVDSAGTGGWHVGNSADPRTEAVLAARGYATTHVARQFDRDWFNMRDLIVALDEANVTDLRALRPDDSPARLVLLGEFDEAGSREVPDPYYGDEADFRRVLDQIERCCDGLVRYIEGAIEP